MGFISRKKEGAFLVAKVASISIEKMTEKILKGWGELYLRDSSSKLVLKCIPYT